MDSLTQAVLGASVGEAVLGKRIGNRASFYGAVAGTIPDLDVLFTPVFDTSSALLFHRGFSHSILFAILAALILSLGVTTYEKYKDKRRWFWLFFLCFFTHALLDAQTTWGVQLLWPLSYRFALDNIFIVDPTYTLLLLVPLSISMMRKRTHHRRSHYNRIGLVLSSSYLIMSTGIKAWAFYQFDTALEQSNIYYERMDTHPTPMNILLWSANIESEDSFIIGHYSIFDQEPISLYHIPKDQQADEMILGDTRTDRMIEFTNGWYTFSQEGDLILLNDLRSGTYGFEKGSKDFVFKYRIEPDKNGEIEYTRINTTPKSLIETTNSLWHRLKGNK